MATKLTGYSYEDNKWLDELISWYGEPTLGVRDEIWLSDVGVRTFVWVPIQAKCTHEVRIERHPSCSTYEPDPRWRILIYRHELNGRWRAARATLEYTAELPPSSDLIRSMYQFVGFENYDRS